jgi:hypothetical protein
MPYRRGPYFYNHNKWGPAIMCIPIKMSRHYYKSQFLGFIGSVNHRPLSRIKLGWTMSPGCDVSFWRIVVEVTSQPDCAKQKTCHMKKPTCRCSHKSLARIFINKISSLVTMTTSGTASTSG